MWLWVRCNVVMFIAVYVVQDQPYCHIEKAVHFVIICIVIGGFSRIFKTQPKLYLQSQVVNAAQTGSRPVGPMVA